MGREGSSIPGVTVIKRQDYKATRSPSGGVFTVPVGAREFLVVCAFGVTTVFERLTRPSAYVMRREIPNEMDPEMAVTGYVLSSYTHPDPLTDLQERLDARERAYWKIHNENQRLRETMRSMGKRGKRGSRDS